MRMVSFFAFCFGLVIGSFLNALLYRFERGESVLRGRSRCPRCAHTLPWHDLVPLLSFALLRGRCRSCKAPISWQYPLVELATGVAFLLVANQFRTIQFSDVLHIVLLWTIASLLIAIAVYDAKHFLIPDAFAYALMGSSLALALVLAYQDGNWGVVWNHLIAGGVAGAFFFSLSYVSKETWMGFGDAKLAAGMGFFLGWPAIVVALFLAFTTGAVAGVALMICKRKTMRSHLPFAPFLAAGAFVAWVAGEAMIRWYLQRLLI